jgi:hypothetical protein
VVQTRKETHPPPSTRPKKEPVLPKLACPDSEKSCLTYSRIVFCGGDHPIAGFDFVMALRRVNYELLIKSYPEIEVGCCTLQLISACESTCQSSPRRSFVIRNS